MHTRISREWVERGGIRGQVASLWGHGQAVVLHRRAAATAVAAARALDATAPAPANQREQHELAERLRAAADLLAPGWLGAPLDAQSPDAPLGGPGLPAYVRIGTAQPLDDARFPAVLPLLGTGHLTIDADSRDTRVAGLLRAVLLRLLAAAPAGSLLIRGVDADPDGTIFDPFAPLTDAGLMPPPATDPAGLRAVLAEAEQWIRPARPAAVRSSRRDRTLLLVIAAWPGLTEPVELTRLGALAQHGPEAGLHLLVAGWPPPPLGAETTHPPLPRSTMIALRNPYALVGDPPGTSFGSPGRYPPSAGLSCPVFLDESPPPRLIDRVCRQLAGRIVAGARPALLELLPDPADGIWTGQAAGGLVTTVGHDGKTAVTLQFNDLTPHWLVSGRSGAGKSAFLVNVLYGLCARYSPSELSVHLVSFTRDTGYADFVPTDRDQSWLPQLRSVGLRADREYGLAVLRELDAELERRSAAGRDHLTAPRQHPAEATAERPPRVLCVLDEFPALLASGDTIAAEALTRLESLARIGRAHGIHLLLASRPTTGLGTTPGRREGVFGQFPVRIALPGGGEVLEPANYAAAGLPLGTAVVNTAGGLGGPRGATRGHERVIRFPDPHADRAVLDTLRRRLWGARAADAPPPAIFTGHRTVIAPGPHSGGSA